MEWRPVVGYEGFYEVSEQGVRSVPRRTRHGHWRKGVELQGFLASPRQYRTFSLSRDGESSHRTHHSLLAEAFIGPRPPGMMVLHRDDDSSNNAVSNLYYGTPSENNLDQVRNGGHRQTQKTHCPRGHLLTEPNLVPSSLKVRQRACLACRDAKNIRRGRPHLDFQEVSDACYWEIVEGRVNPYRRTLSQAISDRVKEGKHQMSVRTHCLRGHLLAEPNLVPSILRRGGRGCMACNKAHGYIRRHGGNLQEVSDRFYEEVMDRG